MLRHDILSTRIDLQRWARTKGPNTTAAANHLAEQLYAHGSEQPPKTRLGLVRAIKRLEQAKQQ